MTILDIVVSGRADKPEGTLEIINRVNDMVKDPSKHDGCPHEIKTSTAVATVTISQKTISED
jgi:hypothetical protein